MSNEIDIEHAVVNYGQAQFEHRKKLLRSLSSEKKDPDLQKHLSRGILVQKDGTIILHRRRNAKQANNLLQAVGGKNTINDYKPVPGLIRELREEIDETISLESLEFIAANDFNGYLTFFYACLLDKVYSQEDLDNRPNNNDELVVVRIEDLQVLIAVGEIAFDHPYYIYAALDLIDLGSVELNPAA